MTVEPTRTKRRFIGMSDGMYKNKTRRKARHCLRSGGQGGIRTRGGLLTHTRFPGVRLKPLIHLSTAERAMLPLGPCPARQQRRFRRRAIPIA